MALAALIVRIGGDLTGLNRALSQVDKDVQRLGKKLASVGQDFSTFLTLPIVALGAVAVRSATQLDSLTRGLTAITGSAEETARQLVRLKEIAKLPGLGFKEVIQGSINLQAVGFSAAAAERSLLAFGNAIATTGGGKAELDRVFTQLTQMASAGKILTADLRPIIQVSPLVGRALKEAFGTISAEKIEKMGLSFEEFYERLVSQLEKLPKVTGGARNSFENLSDATFRLSAAFGKAILPVILPLVDRLADLAERFSEMSDRTKNAILIVGGLVAAIGPLLVVLGTIMKFVPLIGVAFTALTGPIGLVVLAVGALAAAGFQMVKHWDAVQLQFTLAWTAMKDAAFFAIGKILDAVVGMAMAFKQTGLAADVMKLRAELTLLADDALAKAGGKIAALEIKMLDVATAVETAAGAVVSLSKALDKLPDPSRSVDYGWGNNLGGMFGEIGQDTPKKGRRDASPGAMLAQNAMSGVGGEAGQLLQGLAAGMGPLALLLPVVGGALEKLGPVLNMLIEPLVEIGQVIGEALAPIIKMLVPVIQLVADIFIRQLAPVLKGITIALSIVMEAFGWLVRGIGRLIDALPGVSAKGIINAGQAMIDNAQAARRNAQATDGATDAVNSFASALSNIPRVLNINALRHMIAGTGPGGGDGGGGGGGPPGRRRRGEEGKTDVYVTVNVPGAGDPVRVAEAVGQVVQRIASRGGRSRLSVAVAT